MGSLVRGFALTAPPSAGLALQLRFGNLGTQALLRTRFAPAPEPLGPSPAAPAPGATEVPTAEVTPEAPAATAEAAPAEAPPSPAAPPGAPAEVAPLAPREAIAPAAGAIAARARAARAREPGKAARAAAQAAHVGAITKETELRRGIATATVSNIAAAARVESAVDRDAFRARLKQAIAATKKPTSESEAERVIREGAKNASAVVSGELHTQSSQAAAPMATAAAPRAEVTPPEGSLERGVPLTPEQAGAPPAPVAPDSVVPQPLPAERGDFSSERNATDQLMADNAVTQEQMQRANEPEFSAVVQERQNVEAREAQMPDELRAGEAAVRVRARSTAAGSIAQGLGELHGHRVARIGKVAGQQTTTRNVSAAERTHITGELERIKNQTRADVTDILAEMERTANEMFGGGLKQAEVDYAGVFEEEKGGVGTWLTTWGEDWEELIENSLAKAMEAYHNRVSFTIELVAIYVEGKLAQAKRRVQDGKAEADRFVASLDTRVAEFGREANKNIGADFEAMNGEIDQRRDSLVNSLVQQYSESQKRVSALEQKLREENKSLWRRIYDATVGVIKTILAFKDMLLNVLARAAGIIGAILSDPIGFLGNLVDGVKLGLSNFVDNILDHLKEGLLAWMFGALASAGIKIPSAFGPKEILGLFLEVLGLTYQNIRARAVALLGEPLVARLEQTAEIFKVLITEGPAGLWRFLMDKLDALKEQALGEIREMVITQVIKAGITWVIGLLNPASAFIKACKAIYDIVMFFIERGRQLVDLINAILDTLAAIVGGNLSRMAAAVEQALAKAIPVVIGFLASLLGLGGISEKIQAAIQNIQAPVYQAIDWLIGKAVDLVKAAGNLLGFGKKEDKPTPKTDDPEHDVKVEAGLAALRTQEKKYMDAEGEISRPNAEKVATDVKKEHPAFTTLVVVDGGATWDFEYAASPNNKVTGAKKGLPADWPKDLKGLDTPNCLALEEVQPGRPAQYVKDWKKYNGRQTLLIYCEGRAARKLGRIAEKPGVDAYNAASGRGVSKNTKTIEMLSGKGPNYKVVRERIPDIFVAGVVVGDIKNVQTQSLDEQMGDNVRIVDGDMCRLRGSTALLSGGGVFDLVVRGPSDALPEGTHVTGPLLAAITGTGGEVYDELP
ncbi:MULTISPECIES: phage tail protein [unclassified Bradyrhizobium]|uniref:phage tail protein n=1 Tax=unclassified Bradyrhizobium TaxID=2631580 RepID=UPI002FF38010